MEQMTFQLEPRYIRAVDHIQALRGGAPSHLLLADDGRRYVVKFQGNPQGTRILANEWIAAAVFQYLGIRTPAVTAIQVDEAFLAAHPQVCFRLGTHSAPVSAGIHFGSWYVGAAGHDPYEFLPETLLERVHNRRDFIGALVADKWLENADGRQCVFLKSKSRGFEVWMIDHGYILNGPNWTVGNDGDLCGLYGRPMVYGDITDVASFEPWLTAVERCPFHVFEDALDWMPGEWLCAVKAEQLRLVLGEVWQNRRRLRHRLIELCSRRSQHFSGWHPKPAAA